MAWLAQPTAVTRQEQEERTGEPEVPLHHRGMDMADQVFRAMDPNPFLSSTAEWADQATIPIRPEVSEAAEEEACGEPEAEVVIPEVATTPVMPLVAELDPSIQARIKTTLAELTKDMVELSLLIFLAQLALP